MLADLAKHHRSSDRSMQIDGRMLDRMILNQDGRILNGRNKSQVTKREELLEKWEQRINEYHEENSGSCKQYGWSEQADLDMRLERTYKVPKKKRSDSLGMNEPKSGSTFLNIHKDSKEIRKLNKPPTLPTVKEYIYYGKQPDFNPLTESSKYIPSNISINKSFFSTTKPQTGQLEYVKLSWKCSTTNDLLTVFESLVGSPPSAETTIGSLENCKAVIDLLPRDFIGEKSVELRVLDIDLPFEMISLVVQLNSYGRYDLCTPSNKRVSVKELKRRVARKLVMMVYTVDIGISKNR